MLPLIEENVFSFIVHCPLTGTPYPAGEKAGLSAKSVDFINSALTRVVLTDKKTHSKTNGLVLRKAKQKPILAANLAVSYLANSVNVPTRGTLFGAWAVSQHLDSFSDYTWHKKVERDLQLLKDRITETELIINRSIKQGTITEEDIQQSMWLHEAIFTRISPGKLTGTDLSSLYTAKTFIPKNPSFLNEGQVHRICDQFRMPTKAPTRVTTAEFQEKIDEVCAPYNTPGTFKTVWQLMRSAGKEEDFWESIQTLNKKPGEWRKKCKVDIFSSKILA